MRTTIGAPGRIVVPKRPREELGLSPGTELEIEARDDRLEVSVPPAPVRLERRGGGLVAASDRSMPRLTADAVRATLERVRR
ncbi:MAG: AbrB/MazE/SpoVT family DNA-binding domain-containing protein [Thermoleophilaceae bacterium]|nr:AbrB/MazE/SpoVT family DNA-binding domain-containing protein [Thermoleophilaceae bacterium]